MASPKKKSKSKSKSRGKPRRKTKALSKKKALKKTRAKSVKKTPRRAVKKPAVRAKKRAAVAATHGKVYPVPAAVAKRAHIDAKKYKAMYDRSVRNPDGFWAEQAKQFVSWSKPWSKVSDWWRGGHALGHH